MFLPWIECLQGRPAWTDQVGLPVCLRPCPGDTSVLNWENWTWVGAGSRAPPGTACPVPASSSQRRGSLRPPDKPKHRVPMVDGWSEADLGPVPMGRETREAPRGWGEGDRGRSSWTLTSPSPWAGLLLQEMTMAGLHELRFTEEKPLLRSQDAELVSPVTTLAPAPACGVPGCGRGC